MRFIELSDFEIERIKEQFKNHKSPVIQKRIRMLELSSQYKSMEEITKELNVSNYLISFF